MTDPHTTIAQLLHQPETAVDVDDMIRQFQAYFKSEQSDTYDVMCAAKDLNNPNITKRLGFLTELYFPNEAALIEACKIDVTEGTCVLHPSLTDTELDTNWQIYVSQDLRKAAEKIKVKKTKSSLKRGYTTGACATAASLAATQALVTGQAPSEVMVELPLGDTVKFVVNECYRSGQGWFASVRKDAGDDPDVTHLALICSTVTPSDESSIFLKAGEGVGQVTKPGLGLEVGVPAINRVPRKMIMAHVSAVEGCPKGLIISISIPNGEKLAKKTLNERLGIVGGLSILGTTGIVKPFSTAAYRASIVQAIKVAVKLGREHLVLTTGGKSERYAQKIFPRLEEDAFIQMGDFVGAAMRSANKKEVSRISICGMVGKISKIANRKDMTHAAGSSVNMELMAEMAKDCGANKDLEQAIREANTARHVGELICEAGIEGFYDKMCQHAANFVFEDIIKKQTRVDVILTDLETGDILGEFTRQ